MTGTTPAGGDDEEIAVDGIGIGWDVTSARRKSHGPPPPPRPPRHVLDVPNVQGRRVVVMSDSGPHYDFRAASEVWIDDAGSWIKVVEEWRWYAYVEADPATRPPSCPRAMALPTTNVWVEEYPGTPASESESGSGPGAGPGSGDATPPR